METLKQEAIKAISKLPESANIDDIMYELYVIDNNKKGLVSGLDGLLPKCQKLENVMLNSFQHLINSICYETLNQVQGDTNRFGQQPVDMGQSKQEIK